MKKVVEPKIGRLPIEVTSRFATSSLAESTKGFSGAELMGVVQDAAQSADSEGVKPPTIGHLLVAVEEASSPRSEVPAVEEEACVAAAQ